MWILEKFNAIDYFSSVCWPWRRVDAGPRSDHCIRRLNSTDQRKSDLLSKVNLTGLSL